MKIGVSTDGRSMIGRLLQGYAETAGLAWRALQNLSWHRSSSRNTISLTDQSRTHLGRDGGLCSSKALPVRIRCVRGLYLAATSFSVSSSGERSLTAVKRHLSNASSTVLLLHAPDSDRKPWELTDSYQRPLRVETAEENSNLGTTSVNDPNAVPKLLVSFEVGSMCMPKAYVHIRVGSRYLSVNPTSGKVTADRTHAKHWESFQLEFLPTYGIERPLHRACAFAAFMRARDCYDANGGWLWYTVLFSGQVVALPWDARISSKQRFGDARPTPFFFEYADASRTVVIRDVSGRYLHTTEDGGKHVVAHTFLRHVAEKFTIRAYPRNLIQLESRWGYLSIDQSRKNQNTFLSVRCDRRRADSWELFQLIPVIHTGFLNDWWDAQKIRTEAVLPEKLRRAGSVPIQTIIELRDGTRRVVKASASVPGVTTEVALRTVTDYDHYGNFCRGVAVCRTVESHQSEHGKISLVRTTQSRSLWIFTVKAQMLLRAEEYPQHGQVRFVFISGQGVRRYAAHWEIREQPGSRSDHLEDQHSACFMSLTIDFQPVIFIPKNWLDAMAMNAAKDAVQDMVHECSARMQLLNDQKKNS